MASMVSKRLEYLKRKHKKESAIRVDNGKMLALLSELTITKEEQMNSNDWVAEHVMGFKRGYCQGTMGGGSTGSDGTSETWFRCERCGRHIYDGKTPRLHRWGDGHRVGEPTLIETRESGPCPKYPFPKFTLADLMRKLGEKGYHVMVRVDPEREYHKFTVVVNSVRVCDTDTPLKSLCGYLYSKRELWQRFEEVLGPWHGPRKPKKKRFVSGEQVLEEYIPDYKRRTNALNWGVLYSQTGECNARIRLLEERFEALLEELPPEVINFRTI